MGGGVVVVAGPLGDLDDDLGPRQHVHGQDRAAAAALLQDARRTEPSCDEAAGTGPGGRFLDLQPTPLRAARVNGRHEPYIRSRAGGAPAEG